METRTKSNTEFRNEVSEILARHESGIDLINNKMDNKFEKVDSTLQTIIDELKALRPSHNTTPTERDLNPFAHDAASPSQNTSHTENSQATLHQDRNHNHPLHPDRDRYNTHLN